MARILVVDDTKEIRNIVRIILSDLGHEVLSAENGFESLEIIEKYKIDLVVLDVEMPDGDGFILAKTLRNLLNFSQLPIVFLTSRQKESDVRTAAKLKAEAYILKPIKRNILIKEISKVLKQNTQSAFPKVTTRNLPLSDIAHIIERSRVKVVAISEVGITVHSETKFELEQRIEIDHFLFEQIGIPKHLFQVVHTRRLSQEKCWETNLNFLGISKESIHLVRTWISTNSTVDAA